MQDSKVTIIFSHGKEGTPHGVKAILLNEIAKSQGCKFISIDYTNTKSPSKRVAILKEQLAKIEASKVILVGSSMGGYISAVVAMEFDVLGLFLLAPAFYFPDYEIQDFSIKTQNIHVIHGWNDDVVPYENSIRFCKKMKCKLELVNDNHRLHETLMNFRNSFLYFMEKLMK